MALECQDPAPSLSLGPSGQCLPHRDERTGRLRAPLMPGPDLVPVSSFHPAAHTRAAASRPEPRQAAGSDVGADARPARTALRRDARPAAPPAECVLPGGTAPHGRHHSRNHRPGQGPHAQRTIVSHRIIVFVVI